jgi:hypothetical protein
MTRTNDRITKLEDRATKLELYRGEAFSGGYAHTKLKAAGVKNKHLDEFYQVIKDYPYYTDIDTMAARYKEWKKWRNK